MKAKYLIGRFFGCLYLQFVYRWWSRLYRLIWERKYSDVPLDSYRTIDDLVETMERCDWVKDGPPELGDAISYPGWVQWMINDNPPPRRPPIGDCDEFAVYLANVLEQSSTFGGFSNGRFVLEPFHGLIVDRARILTVMYLRGDGTYGGHNVCLIDWFDPSAPTPLPDGACAYSYMDYHYPSQPRYSIESVVEQVMGRYAPGGHCLGWSVHDKDLRLEKIRWGWDAL